MGRFLNKGNRKFAEFAKTKYFVDKTALINQLLEKDITEKFICLSRPRRFGKSVTADMLVAYFSKGADSRNLFEPLCCVKDELFLESLNRFDTIFIDIQAQFEAAHERNENPIQRIRTCVVKELHQEYPEIVSQDDILADAEMASWLSDTMMLEVDTMSEQDVQDHIQNVQNIVNEYYDIVVN